MATKIAEEMTSQEELFNHLYEACNILRGPINQDEFKSYVTPILFFKRISERTELNFTSSNEVVEEIINRSNIIKTYV